MKARVFVTGAEGFIGSHVVEALVHAGHKTTATVLYNSFGQQGWLEALPKDVYSEIDVRLGDIRDAAWVRENIKNHDVVINLAALIAIPYSYQAPDAYVQTNVLGTLNVLNACRDWGVGHIIQTSTSEVYGSAQFVPITEEHPLQAQSPYAATKIASDQLALSYFKSFSTPITVLRPFNAFGPRQSLRAVIPTIITQAHRSGEVELGDTSTSRDFTYVTQTASAFVAAILRSDLYGDVFNVGSDFEITIGDVVRAVSEITGKDLVVKSNKTRLRPEKSEVQRLWASSQKFKSLTGWRSKFEGIEGFKSALSKTIDWYKDPNNATYFQRREYVV